MKRILIALMATMMVVATTACGNSGSTSSASSDGSSSETSSVSSPESSSSEESSSETEAPSQADGDASAAASAGTTIPVPEDATDDEKAYIDQLNTMLPAIASAQSTQVDTTDEAAAQKMVDDMKKSLSDLAALKAPAKYEAAQAKYAEGANALIEYLDYAMELSSLTSEEMTAEKQEEAIGKATELTTTALMAITEATQAMMGGEATPAAAPADDTAPVEGSSSAAEGETSSAAE